MRLMMSVLLILIGGGVLFVAACVLEVIISGVLGFVLIQETGIGVPFRFFALGLGLLSSGYFSAARLLLDLAHLVPGIYPTLLRWCVADPLVSVV
jgi:hypothetical protein